MRKETVETLPAELAARCPVRCMEAYVRLTNQKLGEQGKCDTPRATTSQNGRDALFLITKAPYTPATSQTISHWRTDVMARAGIDTDVYKSHSYRMASTSKAIDLGVDREAVAQRWSSPATMDKHYNRAASAQATSSSSKAARRGLNVVSTAVLASRNKSPTQTNGSSSSTTA